MIYAAPGYESDYSFQTKLVPASGGDWDFTLIRRINLMLDNIDNSEMSQTDKEHWRSVGYFFRALRYFDLVAAFGDVPWIEHIVSDTTTTVLYGPRTPRDIVTKNILDNLIWAETHIKAEGNGINTINKNVVRALISRFALFEGTWRKYHGLSESQTYLQASATASKDLIATFPSIMSSYDDLFNSDELAGKTGIILCKQYATSQAMHSISRVVRSSAWYADVTKDAMESYLCTDGKPISTSPLYEGDKSVYDVFRKRDRRLYFTVLPPYKVNVKGGNATTFTFTENAADREYIDLMESLSPAQNKRLPVSNFLGYLVNMSPHFRNYNGGQGFLVSQLGYYFYKFYNYNIAINTGLPSSQIDYPLFRIEEIMLNYTEASFELGNFNQEVADQTINKLRTRASVAQMNVSEIDAAFDPARDQSVDPVLWEIRRERRIELMGEGFRFRDLKRWKKGEYMNKQSLGVWVKNSDFGNKLKILGGGTEGYVYLFGTPKGWLDYYYLEPIPTREIVLNPNLVQNPEWQSTN
jgi:hypothetical protein